MKLALSQQKDIQILKVADPVSLHDLEVLKAGITKLFRSGKNRIVLELAHPQSLPPEVLREVAVMNLFAQELAGQIVLAGIDAQTKVKIQNFSKPPIIGFFENVNEAVASFATPPPTALGAPPPNPEEVKAKKEKIRQNELNSLADLRKEVESLRKENHTLLEQLERLVVHRRAPPDPAAYQERIRILETQLNEALAQNTAAAAKNPS